MALKYKITHKVDSHRVNPRYPCLIINLLNDRTFHYKIRNGALVKADIMPTDDWALELCKFMYKISPSFREKLVTAIILGDWDE